MPVYIGDDPDREWIQTNLRYCPDTGHLFWRVRAPGRMMDRPAGHVNSDGYRVIRVRGKLRTAHRMIYILHNGQIPEGMQVDHIDGSGFPKDNRIDNLRLGTHGQNGTNRTGAQPGSKSGVRGVWWDAKYKKFFSRISLDYQRVFLGYFDCPWEAAHAFNVASKKHYGEFSGTPAEIPLGFRHPVTNEVMQPPQWFIDGTEPPPKTRKRVI